jgi:hypothetical protein
MVSAPPGLDGGLEACRLPAAPTRRAEPRPTGSRVALARVYYAAVPRPSAVQLLSASPSLPHRTERDIQVQSINLPAHHAGPSFPQSHLRYVTCIARVAQDTAAAVASAIALALALGHRCDTASASSSLLAAIRLRPPDSPAAHGRLAYPD